MGTSTVYRSSVTSTQLSWEVGSSRLTPQDRTLLQTSLDEEIQELAHHVIFKAHAERHFQDHGKPIAFDADLHVESKSLKIKGVAQPTFEDVSTETFSVEDINSFHEILERILRKTGAHTAPAAPATNPSPAVTPLLGNPSTPSHVEEAIQQGREEIRRLREEMQTRHDEQMQHQEEAHQAQLETLQNQHQDALAQLRGDQENERDRLAQTVDQANERHRHEMEVHQQQHVADREDHREQMEQIRADHQDALTRLGRDQARERATLARALDQANVQHRQAVEQLQADHKEAMEAAKAHAEDQQRTLEKLLGELGESRRTYAESLAQNQQAYLEQMQLLTDSMRQISEQISHILQTLLETNREILELLRNLPRPDAERISPEVEAKVQELEEEKQLLLTALQRAKNQATQSEKDHAAEVEELKARLEGEHAAEMESSKKTLSNLEKDKRDLLSDLSDLKRHHERVAKDFADYAENNAFIAKLYTDRAKADSGAEKVKPASQPVIVAPAPKKAAPKRVLKNASPKAKARPKPVAQQNVVAENFAALGAAMQRVENIALTDLRLSSRDKELLRLNRDLLLGVELKMGSRDDDYLVVEVIRNEKPFDRTCLPRKFSIPKRDNISRKIEFSSIPDDKKAQQDSINTNSTYKQLLEIRKNVKQYTIPQPETAANNLLKHDFQKVIQIANAIAESEKENFERISELLRQEELPTDQAEELVRITTEIVQKFISYCWGRGDLHAVQYFARELIGFNLVSDRLPESWYEDGRLKNKDLQAARETSRSLLDSLRMIFSKIELPRD